tara:strand:+ start:72 stop:554 length:483 start_codon:yes stop_codon:yes gene_type:complete
MPCTQCKDEKYKWGNTGECKYATKDECEKANPKKYSKMNPTPLGKKTYAEYEKELKEFNLSSEVKKLELGAVDDLNKLGKQFDSTLKDIKETGEKANKLNEKIEKLGKLALKQFPKINGLEDEISSQLKSLGLNEKDVPSLADARKSLDNFYTYRKRYNF